MVHFAKALRTLYYSVLLYDRCLSGFVYMVFWAGYLIVKQVGV
jgi:hypothetical protein